ncbi:MAG: hypothetical protein N2554_08820 [Fimbriimonadales bacterium]|nr:hypothetical protein [Fimbriimonadales bacterium]
MRSVLAVGWLITATLAFWLAYWGGGEANPFYRVGMALYALLLMGTLVIVARDWLNALRQEGGAGR